MNLSLFVACCDYGARFPAKLEGENDGAYQVTFYENFQDGRYNIIQALE